MTRDEIHAAVARGQFFNVYLDGALIHQVIDCDPDHGWVETFAKHPETGNAYLNETFTDVVRERLHGKIEVLPI